MNVIYERAGMAGVEITRRMAVDRLARGTGNIWVRLADPEGDRVLVSAAVAGEPPQVQVSGLGYRDGEATLLWAQLLVEAGALARDAEKADVLLSS